MFITLFVVIVTLFIIGAYLAVKLFIDLWHENKLNSCRRHICGRSLDMNKIKKMR